MTEKKTHFGRAGEYFAMSELLLRGWNVAVPVVDVGDDIFVIDDRDKVAYRVQAKTSAADPGDAGRVRATFKLSRDQLRTPLAIELFYMLMVRAGGTLRSPASWSAGPTISAWSWVVRGAAPLRRRPGQVLIRHGISEDDAAEGLEPLLREPRQQDHDLRRNGSVHVLVVRGRLVGDEDARVRVYRRAEHVAQPPERERIERIRLTVTVHVPEDDDRGCLRCCGLSHGHATSML